MFHFISALAIALTWIAPAHSKKLRLHPVDLTGKLRAQSSDCNEAYTSKLGKLDVHAEGNADLFSKPEDARQALALLEEAKSFNPRLAKVFVKELLALSPSARPKDTVPPLLLSHCLNSDMRYYVLRRLVLTAGKGYPDANRTRAVAVKFLNEASAVAPRGFLNRYTLLNTAVEAGLWKVPDALAQKIKQKLMDANQRFESIATRSIERSQKLSEDNRLQEMYEAQLERVRLVTSLHEEFESLVKDVTKPHP